MSDTTHCKCGRDRARLHCPFCGNATVVAQPSKLRVVDNIAIMSYRCRKCGKLFDDTMRELCGAPEPTRARSLAVTNKITVNPEVASMTREQRMQWVREQLNKSTKKEESHE